VIALKVGFDARFFLQEGREGVGVVPGAGLGNFLLYFAEAGFVSVRVKDAPRES